MQHSSDDENERRPSKGPKVNKKKKASKDHAEEETEQRRKKKKMQQQHLPPPPLADAPSSPDFPPPPDSPDFPPPPDSPDFPPPDSPDEDNYDNNNNNDNNDDDYEKNNSTSPPPPASLRRRPQRSVDETVYVRTFDTYTVSVTTLAIRQGRLEKSILRTIANEISGKCGRSGYVRPGSIELVSQSAGRAAQNGYIEFEARVMYDCCRPLLNSLLPAPMCVCTSNNEAAVIGEVRDSHGNVVATVLLSREGIVAPAGDGGREEGDDVVATAHQQQHQQHLVASPNEMANVLPGDTFGCIVRTVQFELMDPMVTVMGQLLTARVEADDEVDDDEEYADDDVRNDDAAAADGVYIEHLSDFKRIMTIHRVDLSDLRQKLVAETAQRVTDGKAFQAASSAASSSSSTTKCAATRTLVEFRLANDHTAYITIALQETPLLATNVMVRKRGTAQQTMLDSFVQAWDKHPLLRKALLDHLRDMERGAITSPMRDRNGRPVLDDLVELRYKNQDNFGYKLATTFMPAHAKAVYEYFGAKTILDPCGGWGDRLAGALALREASKGELAQKYVCFDPNRSLRRGYRRIAELFDVGESQSKKMEAAAGAAGSSSSSSSSGIWFDNGFEAYSLPFEEGAPALLADDSFDLVFTSPPFFNYEVYSASNPDYQNNWLDKFYRPLMEQSARCVKAGGRVCIHIDDTSAGQIEPFLCEEVPGTLPLQLEGRIALRGVFSAKPRSVWVFVVTK